VAGQPASALTAEGNHKFSVMKFGVKMTFIPDQEILNFEQSGIELNLSKKNKEMTTTDESPELAASSINDINQYLGTYTCDLLPINLTISKEQDQLIGQGEGQSSFTLTASGNHTYSNKDIGITITFVPDENKMHFAQGEAEFEMILED